MKIVENNVKCTPNFIKNYELSFKFCPQGGDFVKKFCRGVGVLNENLVAPRPSY